MGHRVLVIEDNRVNLYLVQYLLEKAGHQVVAADDGPAGLRAARENPPDVILLDIQLPGMDGYEVVAELRNDPKTASVPVIAVTAEVMAGDRERMLAAGANDCIEKPIDATTFVGQVERVVAG